MGLRLVPELRRPDLFRHACLMGLEGLVSKHSNRAYRAGVSPSWVKVKNPAAPAVRREAEEDWN